MSIPLKKQPVPQVPEPEQIKPSPASFTIAAHWMTDDDVRLNADYYADEVVRARHLLSNLRPDAKSALGDEALTSAIFNLGRFKRIYGSDQVNGLPYLEANEVSHFEPVTERYLSPRYAPKLAAKHMAEPGTILVTCSGSVGRVTFVSERLRGFFLTHDLIRVIPATQTDSMPGYLAAYLQTWPAQALMTKQQYGGPIRHLEPKHISPLPVFIPSDADRVRIGSAVERAYAMRDRAVSLLVMARELLVSGTGLPDMPSPTQLGYALPSGELDERLDGSYHSPLAAAVRGLVKDTGKFDLLGRLARVSIPGRFKRIYVAKEHGIPLLQGSHISLNRPLDMGYLSRSAHTDIAKWQIQPGWVLMSCSGTIGRTMLAPDQLADWAASQHIARIIADDPDVAAYLSVFLGTPYGQAQVLRGVHGGVIDEIAPREIESIHVPLPNDDTLLLIANLAREASTLRWEAVDIEENAIAELEMMLEHGLTEYNELVVAEPKQGTLEYDRFMEMTSRLLQVPKSEIESLVKKKK